MRRLVFREKGFSGAGVQDITTAAGVPKGSFYNHFDSEQALAAEIVTRYAQATDVRSLFDEQVPRWRRCAITSAEHGWSTRAGQ